LGLAHKPKILVVTTCGARKKNEPKPAWQLYRSPRVRAVYNRRLDHDFCILSTKYGLVEADVNIEPYEEVLTEQRVRELVPQMVKVIKGYDSVVYFRGGAGKQYFNCIKQACKHAGKALISLGYKYMGGINELPKVLEMVEQGQLEGVSSVKSAQINRF
jgi:hypothetical protein